MNYYSYPYASRRAVTLGRRGMVATAQNLAAGAGLDMIKEGGNAIDAAIAAAACLTVVECTCNGIGGDAFAQVWFEGKLYGLNSSGPSPMGISVEALRNEGHKTMPVYGVHTNNVPGIPAAWAALHGRFGRLPFERVLGPAIGYAEEGFPVAPGIADLWKMYENGYILSRNDPAYAEWYRIFTDRGRMPEAGEMWRLPDHAETLREIAATRAESVYRGALAHEIEKTHLRFGGFLRREDLAAFAPEWVDPIGVRYHGVDVWELPPNGQGIITLMALQMLEGMDVPGAEDASGWHLPIEALKLAMADAYRYITDPDFMQLSAADLLSPAYAERRRALIGDRARLPEAGSPVDGGTVFLTTADGEGNMVSYIQSNFKGFGSGIVVPGTGIALQNRGMGFNLEDGHVNCLEPGKRPRHTIIPGFLTRDGKAWGPFGVMGGSQQPQGHLQMVLNMVDRGLNPQAALDCPRWNWSDSNVVSLEPSAPEYIARDLRRMGHKVEISLSGAALFGRGQIILREDNDVLCGGTEPRADGAVAAY